MVLTLQQLDPVYVDFYLPQEQLADLHNGPQGRPDARCLPGELFSGKITAIDPAIDPTAATSWPRPTVTTRASLLTPGMFANVAVLAGAEQRYLTLPQTAMIYNPYGSTVFLVTTKADFDKQQAAAAVQNNSGPDSRPAKPAPAKGPQLRRRCPRGAAAVRDERSDARRPGGHLERHQGGRRQS